MTTNAVPSATAADANHDVPLPGGPLVTIAIPTYNRASDYLPTALRSAVGQDYPHLEVLVSDNCSPDDTAAVVRTIGGEAVRYVRHARSLGPKGNADFCLQSARGEYFLLLHDDDYIDPDFVSRCMAAIGARRPGLVRAGTRTVNADGSVRYERRNLVPGHTTYDLIDAWFRQTTSLYFCSTLFHTDTLRATGGLVSRTAYFDDVASYIRVSSVAGQDGVPDIKASYRRHDANRGGAAALQAWCDDSLYVLDLLATAVPDRADELRQRGLRFFCENNYYRADRIEDPEARREAFATVYRMLPCGFSPADFRRQQRWRRLKRRLRAWFPGAAGR